MTDQPLLVGPPQIQIWFGEKGGQITVKMKGDISVADLLVASFELYRKALVISGALRTMEVK